ncbi:MAG: redoxin, partial [Acidimicrobiia bacterium]|nr:redoxin [Acidimicrobiia bacterium]
MSPRFARLSFVALVVVAVSAIAVARRSSSEDIVEPPRVASAEALPIETESAPPLQPTGWLNTEPLTAADLEGNVVLYDFWTFGCSNCQHTLP